MPRARIKYTDGMQFVGDTETGHAVVMDSDSEFGGSNTGPRPMELLLIGIGGCSGMDVISILKKKRQNVTGFEIAVNGTKATDHPKKYTDITVEFIVRGKGLSDDAVRKAVEASMTKYCSVKATLEGTAKISYTHRIIEN